MCASHVCRYQLSVLRKGRSCDVSLLRPASNLHKLRDVGVGVFACVSSALFDIPETTAFTCFAVGVQSFEEKKRKLMSMQSRVISFITRYIGITILEIARLLLSFLKLSRKSLLFLRYESFLLLFLSLQLCSNVIIKKQAADEKLNLGFE